MSVAIRFSLVFLSVILACSTGANDQRILPEPDLRGGSNSESLDPRSSPNILVVSAHLDDEILWFEPWLAIARVILTPTVYPISEFMKNHIVLRFLPNEKWIAPMGLTEHDLARKIHHDRNYRRKLITDDFLYDLLKEYVARSDVVVSHSPWGEYGHEKHQQLSCVLLRLVKAYNKDMYIWNGIPDIKRSADGYPIQYVTLVNREGELPNIEMAFDHVHYREVRDIYRRAELDYPMTPGETSWNNRFWTWDWDATQGGKSFYMPPSTAKYYKVIDQGKILYDPDQIKDIISATGTYPDDSPPSNCDVGGVVLERRQPSQ